MHRIASSLGQKAIKVAEKMIKTGETIMPIPFSTAKNCVFLSTDIDEVIALDFVTVDGQNFFIGHKRKNENQE